jgi:hypothetical protein
MTEGNIEEEERQDYLQSILNEFISSGDILEIVPYKDNTKRICQSSIDDIFIFKLKHLIENKEQIFELEFSYKTYTASNQLSVEIMSDSFALNVGKNKSYLEHLKEILSKRLSKDWRKCIWIYDKESEAFSTSLYPHIYETENLFRQLINEVMITIKGANWWDIIVPKSLKEKMNKVRTKDFDETGTSEIEKSKIAIYKALAPAFKHIEEKLLLVEVGDLLRIATLKVKSLSAINSAKVNAIINGTEELDVNALLSELSNASTVMLNLWEECFSKYLSEDFKKNFRIFESNRNHIAHNKMIDKQAYDSILSSIDLVRNELKSAIKKFHNDVLPEEVIRIIELEKQLEEEDAKSNLEEIIESEAGVERRHTDDIYELFDERILSFYYDLEEELKFRNDIELTRFESIVYDESEQELFSIEYKLDERRAVVSCEFNIDDSWGGKSEMSLKVKLDEEVKEYYISYYNGDYEYNDDQGYYAPIQEDEFEQLALNQAKDGIIEFIETHFENLRERVDSEMYRIIKDGESSPVANIPCYECGDDYICIDESLAEYGRCLNCGVMNDICNCERCGNYFEACKSDYREDEPKICGNCLDDIERE